MAIDVSAGEDRIIMTMRRSAWFRAKAELKTVLNTYWSEWRPDGSKIPNGYEEIAALIHPFIEQMDDHLG